MVEQVLGERYAIKQQMGKNAGRRTLLAQDLQTQELVAIKLLSFGVDFQWDDLKLFQREAETLQSLSHPAIPAYLDHFEFQRPKTKGFALVQSYIEAKSLAEWVKLGQEFNEIQIKQLAEALLEILMYLHQQKPPVIHRDIKPSNILLRQPSGESIGQVYLVDFGSVQTLAATEGSTLTIVGTYGYMPPEQFGGTAVPASDLYSLGATLIYLVTGTHPAELPQVDLQIQFEPKIHLSETFVDWLKWMTEPDLNKRFTSAEEALNFLAKPGQTEKNLPVKGKPVGSRIQLKKARNALEIFIPAQIEYTDQKGQKHIIIVNNSLFRFRRFWTWAKNNPSHLLLLISVPGACLIVAMFEIEFSVGIIFIVMFLLAITKSTRMRIDQQQIYLIHEWFGAVRYQIQPASPRQTICKLGFLHSDNRRSIQIWAGTQEYVLPTKDLSDSEIDWIADELSQWLDLPITKS